MSFAVIILAILFLCGCACGKALAICAIILAVCADILAIGYKKRG